MTAPGESAHGQRRNRPEKRRWPVVPADLTSTVTPCQLDQRPFRPSRTSVDGAGRLVSLPIDTGDGSRGFSGNSAQPIERGSLGAPIRAASPRQPGGNGARPEGGAI